jgi:hypothetical protein
MSADTSLPNASAPWARVFCAGGAGLYRASSPQQSDQNATVLEGGIEGEAATPPPHFPGGRGQGYPFPAQKIAFSSCARRPGPSPTREARTWLASKGWRPRWTPQNRPVVDGSKPASWASGLGDIYLVASSTGKASPTLIRQLRGPHLRTWPWWRRRSSMAATAAASPRTLPQSFTGRFEVKRVLALLGPIHDQLQQILRMSPP